MKKYLLICLLLLFAACRDTKDERLNNFVVNQLTHNKKYLSFKEFKEVTWDRMYIVPPYTNKAHLDSTLLSFKSTIFKTGIESRDDICIIMLFNHEQLSSMATFSSLYEFASTAKFVNYKLTYYKKDNAVFSVTHDGNLYHFRHK